MIHYLVFGNTGEFAGWGDESALPDILSDFAGTPLIVLTPMAPDDSMLAGTVAHIDGEDCWAGIYYLPEAGKFQVKFFGDSNEEDYFSGNYLEAIEHARKLVR